MQTEHTIVAIDGPVLTVTLNHPDRRNALSTEPGSCALPAY